MKMAGNNCNNKLHGISAKLNQFSKYTCTIGHLLPKVCSRDQNTNLNQNNQFDFPRPKLQSTVIKLYFKVMPNISIHFKITFAISTKKNFLQQALIFLSSFTFHLGKDASGYEMKAVHHRSVLHISFWLSSCIDRVNSVM